LNEHAQHEMGGVGPRHPQAAPDVPPDSLEMQAPPGVVGG
jgi:hypothetical protein